VRSKHLLQIIEKREEVCGIMNCWVMTFPKWRSERVWRRWVGWWVFKSRVATPFVFLNWTLSLTLFVTVKHKWLNLNCKSYIPCGDAVWARTQCVSRHSCEWGLILFPPFCSVLLLCGVAAGCWMVVLWWLAFLSPVFIKKFCCSLAVLVVGCQQTIIASILTL